jgi:hypothetical protein
MWNGGREDGEVAVSLGLVSIGTLHQLGNKRDQRCTIKVI